MRKTKTKKKSEQKKMTKCITFVARTTDVRFELYAFCCEIDFTDCLLLLNDAPSVHSLHTISLEIKVYARLINGKRI